MRLATIVALGVLALAAGAAGAPPAQKARTTPGWVESLAMDGSRIAYDVQGNLAPGVNRCNRVYAWNVATGTTTAVSGKRTCEADITSTGAGVSELAVAGPRVAWIVNQGGNSESTDELFTAVLPKPKERKLASALRTRDLGGMLEGDWIGGLVGSGSFLGANRWVTDSTGIVTSARLVAIGARLRTIATGPTTTEAQATDGKLIAVLRGDETVGIYSTAGKVLRVVKPRSATDVAVRGDYLAVLTKTARLEVRNSHSGRLLHTWVVAKGATSLDVQGGLAVYCAPKTGARYPLRTVHVLRLKTGRDTVLTTQAHGIVAVQIEAPGVAYAVNTPASRGAVVFVPMKRVTG
jgi:hypothetical protein